VVAPDIGAFAERLGGRAWSWIARWDQTAAEWLDFFIQIRREHFVQNVPPVRPIFVAECDSNKLFTYVDDYLQSLHFYNSASHAIDLQQPARFGSSGRPSLKLRALSTLIRLRSSRGLRGVARALPHQWQMKVKTWLKR
jgi:hypothetical protein